MFEIFYYKEVLMFTVGDPLESLPGHSCPLSDPGLSDSGGDLVLFQQLSSLPTPSTCENFGKGGRQEESETSFKFPRESKRCKKWVQNPRSLEERGRHSQQGG